MRLHYLRKYYQCHGQWHYTIINITIAISIGTSQCLIIILLIMTADIVEI